MRDKITTIHNDIFAYVTILVSNFSMAISA